MYQIAYDAKRAFLNMSGLGNYSRLLLSSLSACFPGNMYHLFTPPYPDHDRLGFAESGNVCIHVSNRASKLGTAWWRAHGMSKEVNAGPCGLFHGLSAELPSWLKIPAVVTVHDLIFLRYPRFYSPIDRMIYKAKTAAACKQASKVLAISRQTADDLVRLLGVPAAKIEVVYQSCDPIFYKTPPADPTLPEGLPQAPYILNVGTMEARKNLLTLVEALALLPKELHLVALGRRTPYAARVEARAAELGLAGRLHLLSGIRFSDFPAIYRKARVMVYPSLYEGFGLPVLEALAAEVPCVSSSVSSLPEAGGDGALYANPGQAAELAACIRSLLEDSALRLQQIEKGRRHAHNLRPEACAARVHEIYESLLH